MLGMFPVGVLLSLSSIISPLSLFDVVVVVVIAARISRLRSKIPLSLRRRDDGVILIFLLPGRDPSGGEVRARESCELLDSVYGTSNGSSSRFNGLQISYLVPVIMRTSRIK